MAKEPVAEPSTGDFVRIAQLLAVAEEQARISAMQGGELTAAVERIAAARVEVDAAARALSSAGKTIDDRRLELVREIGTAVRSAAGDAARPIVFAVNQAQALHLGRAWWRGALVGALLGLVLGAVAGQALTYRVARDARDFAQVVFAQLQQQQQTAAPVPAKKR